MTKKTKKNYSREFKEEAVKLVTEQGYGVSEAARNLGIRPNMLGRWKREFEEETIVNQLGDDEKVELKRLREENRRLKMEREILKKAAAHLSRTKRDEVPIHLGGEGKLPGGLCCVE